MRYDKKPKMIIFDVGGTLLDDGPCIVADGFSALRKASEKPDATTDEFLAERWDEYISNILSSGFQEKGDFEIPLPCVLKYATTLGGLKLNIPIAQQEELFDRFNSTREVIGGLRELLLKLKEKNIRTAVISNNMMSGEALALSLKHWIPESDFEFVLSSADVLYKKPDSHIFNCAVSLAQLEPYECWYCGDSFIPDVFGSEKSGLAPVLLDRKSEIPFEMRRADTVDSYLTVNHWSVLKNHIEAL